MNRRRILFPTCLLWLAAAAPGPSPDTLAPPSAPAPAAPMPSPGPVSPGSVPTPVAPASSAAPVLSKADLDAWLDGYLPFALRVADIAGAEIAVVKDGRILTERGYGHADIARRIPVDPDRTLFRPGSVSKLITWTAVMQLVERHRLDLDADVNDYLDFRIPPRDGQPITLRQIMTHTAGFAERAKDISSYDRNNLQTLGAFLKAWIPERIFAPGTTPAYSNWATALAGYIVQRVSGMPFDDYVEQHVFAPLGMTDSTFRQPLPARLAPQMSLGYRRASEPPQPFEFIGPFPAGSLSTTAGDMARFMIAHLQDGVLDDRRILDAATARTMHDSPLDRVNPMSLIPPLDRMELGFFETNVNGHEVIGHLGDVEAFHTILHLFTADGVGLYASFNSPGKDAAVQQLRMALLRDFADRYFPATGRDGRVAPEIAAQHARMMLGRWQGSRRSAGTFLAIVNLLGQVTVSTTPSGELVVSSITDPSGAVRHWVEIAPFVWRDVAGPDRLAAKLVDGKVERWSWNFESPFEVLERVPAAQSAGWILPALAIALPVLLLSVLSWPASWLIRRRYRAVLPVTGAARLAYRLSRLTAGLVLLVLAGWAATILRMLADTDALTARSDPALWVLQVGGLVVFVAGVLATGWNALLAWSARRRWGGKLWSALMLPSSLLVLYVAWTFDLLSMTVHY